MMGKARGRTRTGKRRGVGRSTSDGSRQFNAEAAYAESIVRSALGDGEGCIAALEHSLKMLPTYAPAILSMGSVEYQRGRHARGRRLFLSLLDQPARTPDLCEILDEAGDFLIQRGAYADGLELYRRSAARFPRVAVFHQGLGCCAGHEGLHDEAVAASRAALALEPKNQKFVNDLGWSLYQAGSMDEARAVLKRAVAMDPANELAAENLRICSSDPKAPGLPIVVRRRRGAGERRRARTEKAAAAQGEFAFAGGR